MQCQEAIKAIDEALVWRAVLALTSPTNIRRGQFVLT